jgi:hypothetical protein
MKDSDESGTICVDQSGKGKCPNAMRQWMETYKIRDHAGLAAQKALSQNSFLSKNEAAPLLRQSNVENKGRIRKKCAKHPEGARRTLSGCCLFC